MDDLIFGSARLQAALIQNHAVDFLVSPMNIFMGPYHFTETGDIDASLDTAQGDMRFKTSSFAGPAQCPCPFFRFLPKPQECSRWFLHSGPDNPRSPHVRENAKARYADLKRQYAAANGRDGFYQDFKLTIGSLTQKFNRLMDRVLFYLAYGRPGFTEPDDRLLK
jgi:hypothetical protein